MKFDCFGTRCGVWGAGAAWFELAVALVVIPAGALLVRRLTPAPTPA